MIKCKIAKLYDKIVNSGQWRGSDVYLIEDDKQLILDAINHFRDGAYYYINCTCATCKENKEDAEQ